MGLGSQCKSDLTQRRKGAKIGKSRRRWLMVLAKEMTL
jgi:hypothetical protein